MSAMTDDLMIADESWQTSIQCDDEVFQTWTPESGDGADTLADSTTTTAGESERAAALSGGALSTGLSPLSAMYPDVETGVYVARGRITQIFYQNETQFPTPACVMLTDLATQCEYKVRGRFNGLDRELLDYSGHVVEGNLTYIRAYAKKMYGATATALIQTIGQRAQTASTSDRMESYVQTFIHEASSAADWSTMTEDAPFDILYWLVSQYRRKREWAASILDNEAVRIFWIHHLCPEILLFRTVDTVRGLCFAQLLDLKQQYFDDWTAQFLRQTWVASDYDTPENTMRPIRNPTMMCSADVDPDMAAAAEESGHGHGSRRTNIRMATAHGLPIVSLKNLEQLYKHVEASEGAYTIRLRVIDAASETRSFHVALHVLMKECSPQTFMMMAYLELFIECIEGSTMMPLLGPVTGAAAAAAAAAASASVDTSAHGLRRVMKKSILRFDEPFLYSINLLDVLCTPNCKARFASIVYMYHFIYWNHPDYRSSFGCSDEEGNFHWPIEEQRDALVHLVRHRVMCVFSNESEGRIYVMTRDALEHALYYRHALVQFVARAENLQSERERVIQWMDPDHPDYLQLNEKQRNVFAQLATRKKFLILLLGPGGTGKTRTAQCFHLVESIGDNRSLADIQPYRDIPVPRLLEPLSRQTGLPWVVGGLAPSPSAPTAPPPSRPLMGGSLMDEFDDPWDDATLESAANLAATATEAAAASEPPIEDTEMPALDMPFVSTLWTATRPIEMIDVPHPSAAPPLTNIWTPVRPPVRTVFPTVSTDSSAVTASAPAANAGESSEGAKPSPQVVFASGKKSVLFLVPMLSQRADASRRLGVTAQTYAHMTAKVPHGIGEEMSKTLVLFEDEVSMQSNAQTVGLLHAMEQMDLAAVVKMGDQLQLPSVEPGNVLQDLYDMMKNYERRKKVRAVCVKRGLPVPPDPLQKSREECLRTDDLAFLCERVHLEELTVNHRVDAESSSLLPYLDCIRYRKCDQLLALLVNGEGCQGGQSHASPPPPPKFRCVPLMHPDGGFLDLDRNRSYTEEQRSLLEMYDENKTAPHTYQILVSTNPCRNFINALLAQYAGYTMQLHERFHNMSWAHHNFGGGSGNKFESDLIVPGSLRVQANMKVLFQSDFTQDGQTMHANTIFVVSSVIRVPFFMLLDCVRRIGGAAAPHPASSGGGGPASTSSRYSAYGAAAPSAATSTSASPLEFIKHLTWQQLQLCIKLDRSVDSNQTQTREYVVCAVVRNQSGFDAPLGANAVASTETFNVVRCTDAFYRRVNLAFACTMHYMQGLQTDHVKIILERAAERRLNQKVMITATGRAQKTVTIYVQRAGNVAQARQQFVEFVNIPSPTRCTVLGEILQDHFAISFDTMDALLA